jgi:hypothetical protein
MKNSGKSNDLEGVEYPMPPMKPKESRFAIVIKCIVNFFRCFILVANLLIFVVFIMDINSMYIWLTIYIEKYSAIAEAGFILCIITSIFFAVP